jgi:cytoskeleton-associated protein 5
MLRLHASYRPSFIRSVFEILPKSFLTLFPPLQLGDGREPIRNRAQQLLQSLPRIYAYSRIFALLLEHGLKAKVSKTRQGALEELGSILKKAGVGACDPPKSFPVIGKMLSDKDPNVRKAALNVFRSVLSLLYSALPTSVPARRILFWVRRSGQQSGICHRKTKRRWKND